jgi:16S rRNA (guanine966-N2)-methyltransferase
MDTRPTSDKVKEALFSILAARIEGARLLDLFGGAGGIGIEALSRGAARVEFVESDRATADILSENIAACGFRDRAEIHHLDVFRFLKRAHEPYDLVFADPPYHDGRLKKLLPALGRGDMISPGGLVIVEHFRKTPLPDRIGALTSIRTYTYGDTALTVFGEERAA